MSRKKLSQVKFRLSWFFGLFQVVLSKSLWSFAVFHRAYEKRSEEPYRKSPFVSFVSPDTEDSIWKRYIIGMRCDIGTFLTISLYFSLKREGTGDTGEKMTGYEEIVNLLTYPSNRYRVHSSQSSKVWIVLRNPHLPKTKFDVTSIVFFCLIPLNWQITVARQTTRSFLAIYLALIS